jgi:regulator of nucleoside diphosphate kinase
MHLPEITITSHDYERITDLLEDLSPDAQERAQALELELERAVKVPPDSISADVVTMNSRVLFEDELTGATREVTLVYPKDADPEAGKVSVLSPVGSALLGVRAGQTIDWPASRGRRMRFRVVSVLYQPEAEGRYDL